MRCIGVVSLVSRCSVKRTTTGLTVSQILSRPPPSFLHCNNLLGRWKFPNTIIIIVVVVFFLRVPRVLYCFLLFLLLSLRLLWVLGVVGVLYCCCLLSGRSTYYYPWSAWIYYETYLFSVIQILHCNAGFLPRASCCCCCCTSFMLRDFQEKEKIICLAQD